MTGEQYSNFTYRRLHTTDRCSNIIMLLHRYTMLWIRARESCTHCCNIHSKLVCSTEYAEINASVFSFSISPNRGTATVHAFIVYVLIYSLGMWELTPTEWAIFAAFHRRKLIQVIGIRYPMRISNNTIYRICAINPLEWSLFGHILPMQREAPAQLAIDQ